MTEKAAIVEHLGQSAVLLPQLLSKALDANDRAKLRMTVLQDALAHAQNPALSPTKLDSGPRAIGLDCLALQAALSGARFVDGEHISLPGGKALFEGLKADLAAMIEPLKVGDPNAAEKFAVRAKAVGGELFAVSEGAVPRALIAFITSASRRDGDSAHLLVMELHKAINELAAKTAVETVDGAAVHGLDASDKARVAAFMRGLNRTRPLAFGHPGLGTSATRSGEALIIQNDIGATDAHVIVIRVIGFAVTITYTDVHRARARFFMKLIGQEAEWSTPAEQTVKELIGTSVRTHHWPL